MTDLQEEGIEGASFLDGLISQETRRRTREQTQPLIDACCSPGCIRSTVITVGVASLLLTTLLIAVYLTKSNQNNTPSNAIDPYAPPYWMLSQITQDELTTHLKFLSDDLLEGRAPGTRGEALTSSYIASHFRSAGLSPLNQLPTENDTAAEPFIHKIPLRGLTAQKDAFLQIASGDDTLNLDINADFTADSDLSNENLTLNAEMVFAGYCVKSAKLGMDNFGNQINYKDKIVVCLHFEPSSDSNGRKNPFDNLSPIQTEYISNIPHMMFVISTLGEAAGVIMVHSTESSEYTWDTFQNRYGLGEQVGLREQALSRSPLSFKGWTREEVADKIARMNGDTLDYWKAEANSTTFVAKSLSTRFNLNMQFAVREFSGQFVIGYLGPPPTGHSVLLTAHHDGLGIRRVARPGNPSIISEDEKIYSGAVDNGSGLAALITSAYALSALYKAPYIVHPGFEPPPLQKTVLFMTTTADEYDVGTEYFTNTNLCAWYSNTSSLCGAVAAIGYNVMNVWGKTYEAEIVGINTSKVLQSAAEAAIKAESIHPTFSCKN